MRCEGFDLYSRNRAEYFCPSHFQNGASGSETRPSSRPMAVFQILKVEQGGSFSSQRDPPWRRMVLPEGSRMTKAPSKPPNASLTVLGNNANEAAAMSASANIRPYLAWPQSGATFRSRREDRVAGSVPLNGSSMRRSEMLPAGKMGRLRARSTQASSISCETRRRARCPRSSRVNAFRGQQEKVRFCQSLDSQSTVAFEANYRGRRPHAPQTEHDDRALACVPHRQARARASPFRGRATITGSNGTASMPRTVAFAVCGYTPRGLLWKRRRRTTVE